MRPASRVVPVVLLAALLAGCLSSAPPAPMVKVPPDPADCLATLNGLDLHLASIADIQAALAAGTVTSVQLVEAYAARIAAFDAMDGPGPRLNSVQEVSPTARAQAAALDAERAAGRVRGPLHGIPVLLKDNVGTFDEPTTAGSIALAGNVPPRDATLTVRLRDAGAVILGKTHLSEFANWMATGMPNGYSSLGGQVVNAYTGGDPSGSSSGSGVAASMAFAAAAIGTETSGSILGPSDANSLVGVKPTTGLVSRAGVIPLAASFDTPGPMARSVADAAAILAAIAGPDPRDGLTAEAARHATDYTAALDADALWRARLGYDPESGGPMFQRALRELRAQGATLVPIERASWQGLAGLLELPLIFNEFKHGLDGYLATEAGPGLPVRSLTDIILYNQQHPDKVKYGQDHLIESDATPGDATLAEVGALAVVAANRALADRLFAENRVDALVGPGLEFVALGAAAGYPTVIVPAGYTPDGPTGLSFFGPAWSEARLLGYAYAFEQGESMRRQPPPIVAPRLLDGVCVTTA